MVEIGAITEAQPYAQLTARGVRPYVARSTTTSFRGRLAILAARKSTVPSTLFADAAEDPVLEDYLGHFGWGTAEELAKLPRSAIVATVELVDIVEYDDDVDEPPMVGELVKGDYLWELRDAVEIGPILDVRGKPNFWMLDGPLAEAVAEAERIARADPHRAARDMPIPKERERDIWWSVTSSGRLWKSFAEEAAERQRREEADDDIVEWRFREDRFEARFQQLLQKYFLTHQLRGEGATAEVRVDGRNPFMRELFKGAEWVPREKFARVIRRALYNEDAPMYNAFRLSMRGTQLHNRDDWTAWDEIDELSRFVEGPDGRSHRALGPDDAPKRAGGRPPAEPKQ